MNLLFTFTSNLFFLWVARNTFYWVTIWQRCAYRPDRFFDFLKRKKQKIKRITSPFIVARWLLFLLFIVSIFQESLLFYFQYGVALFFFAQSLVVVREVFHNTLKKPHITFRSVFTTSVTLAIVFVIFAIPLLDKFLWLLLIDLCIFILVTLIVFIFSFPIEIYSDMQIEKAVRKLRLHPKLLTIAVTGSRGKSGTKDAIAAVLGKKFKIIKTEGSDNTASGIARTILTQLEDNTDIFVAELSAYKRGEIRSLCKMIHPKIGVLTIINNHHLSLFKSLENIKRTNYELVTELPKDGFCLYNGTSKNTYSLYHKSRKPKVLYMCINYLPTKRESQKYKKDILAVVNSQKKKTSVDVYLKNKFFHFNLTSPAHIEHILPAIFLANYFGMSEREIKRAIASLKW